MNFKKEIEIELKEAQAFACMPCDLAVQRFYVRQFEKKDVMTLADFNYRNADVPFFGIFEDFKNLDKGARGEKVAQFIDYYQAHVASGMGVHYGLFLQKNNSESLIGRVGLTQQNGVMRKRDANGDIRTKSIEAFALSIFMDKNPVDGVSVGRRGYTKIALEVLFKEAQECGIQDLYAQIDKRNEPSIRLCKELGFEFPINEDVLSMVKKRGSQFSFIDMQKYYGVQTQVEKALESLSNMRREKVVGAYPKDIGVLDVLHPRVKGRE